MKQKIIEIQSKNINNKKFKLFSLKDLMYSRDDLKEMLNDLKEKIDKKTEDEINYYLNMSGK